MDKQTKSRSTCVGIFFPVGRIHRHLREGRYSERISSNAPVYLTAVLKFVVDEVFKEAFNKCDKKSTKRIIPNNIVNVISRDKKLNDIFKYIVIRNGGVTCLEDKHGNKSKIF